MQPDGDVRRDSGIQHRLRVARLVSRLVTLGVQFDRGLSEDELFAAQERYGVHFPPDLALLLSMAMPVADKDAHSGFYNWRSQNPDNVAAIRERLRRPGKDLLDFWQNCLPAKQVMKERACLTQAPQLIPVYGHRYISEKPHVTGSPVFSVMGADIVVYGENLWRYLEVEFGLRAYEAQDFDHLVQVPFWSKIALSGDDGEES